jgi:hypothetical protein
MMTDKNVARALPRPLCARIRLAITESEAAKLGILDRWQAAQLRQAKRALKQAWLAGEFQRSVEALLQRAATEEWSQRKLAMRAGLSFRSWRRIRDRNVNPAAWLPKLRAALEGLHLP